MKNTKQLYAGVAKIEITTEKIAVNDPLYAKVLRLEQNGKVTALVSLDYVSMGGGISELSDEFFSSLKAGAKKAGIDTLLCGVTHTHTHFPMSREECEVLERTLAAIELAGEGMKPVKIGSGAGRDSSFLINRTLRLKNGDGWTIRQAHPCPNDEEIAGLNYADDHIGILRVDTLDGTPFCVLFTFGCHPLLGYANNAATANYPGIAERVIEEQTGAFAMMFQSCGGDVTEIEYKNYDKPKDCTPLGLSLGLATLSAWRGIETKEGEIETATKEVVFPLRKDVPSVREKLLKEREEICDSLGGCPLNFKAFLPLYMKYLISPNYPLDYKYAYLREEEHGKTQLKNQDKINRQNLDKYLENLEKMERLSWIATTLETLEWHEKRNAGFVGGEVKSEVVGVKLGDCVLISAPVEPLSEIGRRVKTFSTAKNTFLIGYANGFLHYGAPKEAYNNGGYETIECMLSSEWEIIYETATQEIFKELGV